MFQDVLDAMRKADAETPPDCSEDYGMEMLRRMMDRQHVLCQSDQGPQSSSVVCHERVPFDVRRYTCEFRNVMVTADTVALYGCQKKPPVVEHIISTIGVTETCFIQSGHHCASRSPTFEALAVETAPLNCDVHTPHKVLHQKPWDVNNFYEWFGDWVTIWETLVALGWKATETEVLLHANLAGKDRPYAKPFDEAWALAFREKGVRTGDWPTLYNSRRCFSHIAVVPHGGLSTTTANGGRGGERKAGRCPSPTVMGAALFLQGAFLGSSAADSNGSGENHSAADMKPHITLILRRGIRAFTSDAAAEGVVRSALPPGWTYSTARLEEMTLAQQLGLIRHTAVLVGVHGAGMMHTLFLPAGARVLEVYCADRSSVNGHYRTIEAMAEIGSAKTRVEGTYHFSASPGSCTVPAPTLRQAIGAYERWAAGRPRPTPKPKPRPAASTAEPCALTVFNDASFQGWSATFVEGVYDSAAYVAGGAVDDQASSLKVVGPCTAVLYQNGDFSGWSASFPEGSYTADDMRVRGAIADETSAIMLVRVGRAAQCASNGSLTTAARSSSTAQAPSSTAAPTTSLQATATVPKPSPDTPAKNHSGMPAAVVVLAERAGTTHGPVTGSFGGLARTSPEFVECSSDYQVLTAASVVAAAVGVGASLCFIRWKAVGDAEVGPEPVQASTVGSPSTEP